MQLKNLLAIPLAAVLAVPPGWAQATTPAAQEQPTEEAEPAAEPAPPPGPKEIKIVVLEGEGAKNDIKSGAAVAPRVQVMDDKDQPVEGAEVIFRLPMAGASGAFSGWVRSQTVRTDSDGVAEAGGYAPNDTEGRFNIRVTAKAGQADASVVIAQSNVGGSSKRSNKKWWILGAIGAGAGVAIGVAAARDSSSGGTVTTPVSIAAGPVSVGAPR